MVGSHDFICKLSFLCSFSMQIMRVTKVNFRRDFLLHVFEVAHVITNKLIAKAYEKTNLGIFVIPQKSCSKLISEQPLSFNYVSLCFILICHYSFFRTICIAVIKSFVVLQEVFLSNCLRSSSTWVCLLVTPEKLLLTCIRI